MNILMQTGRGLRTLSLALAGAGGLAMLVMLALVCANIVLRPLGHSIRGTVELSGYLCALAVGLCLPAAQLAGSHITAGLWADSMPRLFRGLARPLCAFFCAGALLLLGRDLLSMAEYVWIMDEYIDGFQFSYFGMIAGFAAGVLLHALIFLHAVLEALFVPERHTRRPNRADRQGGTA